MMQQKFQQPVEQVIQASSVVQKFSDRGRVLTANERRDLNHKVRRVAGALQQNGGLVWKTLHEAVGINSVEEMRIADLPAAQTVLRLLLEESELIEALKAAQKSEKDAVSVAATLKYEIEALKRQNASMQSNLHALRRDLDTRNAAARNAIVNANEKAKMKFLFGLVLGGIICSTAVSAFF